MIPLVSKPSRILPRRTLAYVCAVLLPFVSAIVMQRTQFLRPIPFALYFLTIVIVATLGGSVPSILALVCSIVARVLFPLNAEPFLPVTRPDLLRYVFLLTAAGIISIIGNRVQRSRQTLETALADLHERSDALIESLAAGKCASWTLDLDSGKSARWFSGSYPVFGRPFSEIEQLPSLQPLLHPNDRSNLFAVRESMRTTDGPIVFEHRVPWPNGELHWLEMRATRIPGPGCLWRGITVDVTERKLAEAALLRAEKLAAMGRLASTIAHEINNPLEAVTNLLYLVSTTPGLPPAATKYVETAERELSRLGQITRLALGFVRNTGVISTIDLAAGIDDVITVFHDRLVAKSITVERLYQPGVCVAIAPHELRQIATNLVANAMDALPASGGKIALTILTDRDTAILLVEDDGPGISAANLPRIFEPFFTTKQEVGTGIGLWVTRELVEKNSGNITVESGDLPNGISTRFRVELPLAL
jgi:signal transduction histidine kinase